MHHSASCLMQAHATPWWRALLLRLTLLMEENIVHFLKRSAHEVLRTPVLATNLQLYDQAVKPACPGCWPGLLV